MARLKFKKPDGVVRYIMVTLLIGTILGLSGWGLATSNTNSKNIASLQTWKEEAHLQQKDNELESSIMAINLVLAAEKPPGWFTHWFQNDWKELKADVKKISDKTDLIREEQIKNSARLDSLDIRR